MVSLIVAGQYGHISIALLDFVVTGWSRLLRQQTCFFVVVHFAVLSSQ